MGKRGERVREEGVRGGRRKEEKGRRRKDGKEGKVKKEKGRRRKDEGKLVN
ncbi:MAG TPA: hypothetical protein VGM30_14185 [Puia sp.]|jgi:hypothetical protein